MATTEISTKNGAVALPSGYAIDSQSFSISESQASANTTPFGANKYTRNTGSGTPDQTIRVNGFAKKGGGSDNAGLGSMSASAADTGATATFTIDTAMTVVGLYIVTDISVDISRLQGGAPVSMTLKNGATDPTITWT